MENRHFRQMLTARQKEINSLVCVGLDPLPEKIPAVIRQQDPDRAGAFFLWIRDIIDATAPFASMFKPQHAHWEAVPDGVKVLRRLIAYIHRNHPSIPVVIDCKRGDIFRTQERYGHTHLTFEDADGMNYNGWMGRDVLESLIDPERPGRALVGLGRTSNPSSWEIQDAFLQKEGIRVWERMVELFLLWSRELGVIEDAGVVMGASHEDPDNSKNIYSRHLSRAREIVGNEMWFLIPGIGTQGGFVEETVSASFLGAGSIAINSSSKIIFASSGEDFAEAAAQKAEKLRDQIRASGGNC